MKLSNETVSVLKNFSTINQNLVIKSGSTITTMSAMKNIVAKADVKEEFPQDFAIYDLNEFLSVITFFENPELQFEDSFVVVTEEGSRTRAKYFFSDPSVVTTPTKPITMPECEVKLNLSSDILDRITRGASVIGAPDLALESGTLKATDKKNETANDFEMDLEVESGSDNYKFWFKVENLKLMAGTYDVSVSSSKISNFKNTNADMEYFIALEPESYYT